MTPDAASAQTFSTVHSRSTSVAVDRGHVISFSAGAPAGDRDRRLAAGGDVHGSNPIDVHQLLEVGTCKVGAVL